MIAGFVMVFGALILAAGLQLVGFWRDPLADPIQWAMRTPLARLLTAMAYMRGGTLLLLVGAAMLAGGLP